jgi:hypothetical protein
MYSSLRFVCATGLQIKFTEVSEPGSLKGPFVAAAVTALAAAAVAIAAAVGATAWRRSMSAILRTSKSTRAFRPCIESARASVAAPHVAAAIARHDVPAFVIG